MYWNNSTFYWLKAPRPRLLTPANHEPPNLHNRGRVLTLLRRLLDRSSGPHV